MIRTQRSAVFVLLIVAVLSGCAAGGDPTAAPTSSASPSPTATPMPSPTPTPTAQIASCETLLTAEENAALASEGRTLRDPAHLIPFFPPMQELLDAGGSACLWGKDSGDVFVLVAQVVLDEDAAAARIGQLVSDGWMQTDDPVAGTLVAPEDYDPNVTPAAVYAGGVLYLANYADILGSIVALQ